MEPEKTIDQIQTPQGEQKPESSKIFRKRNFKTTSFSKSGIAFFGVIFAAVGSYAIWSTFAQESSIEPKWSVVVNGKYAQHSNIVTADLNNDGRSEIIFGADGGGTYWLYVYKADGTLYNSNWPLHMPNQRSVYSVSVGDIDGNGRKDLVVSARAGGCDPECRSLSAYHMLFDDNAQPLGIKALATPQRTFSAHSSLVDWNHDGKLDIVFNAATIPGDEPREGRLLVYDFQGNKLLDRFVTNEAVVDPSIAVGDLEGDGKLEVVGQIRDRNIGDFRGQIYVINHLGSIRYFGINVDPRGLVLGDINNDCKLEIVVYGHNNYTNRTLVAAYSRGGGQLWRVEAGERKLPPGEGREPVIANVDSDPEAEIFFYNRDYFDKVFAWNHKGNPLQNWPEYVLGGNNIFTPFIFPVVGSIAGSSNTEILLTSVEGNSGFVYDVWINSWNANGQETEGWPKLVAPKSEGFTNSGQVIVSDLEGDGRVELLHLVSTAIGGPIKFRLNAYELGQTGQFAWPMARHDPQKTATAPGSLTLCK